MNKPKLKLLITRPEKAGRDLQQCLQKQGYQSYCQPFFDYQPRANIEQLQALHAQLSQPIVIFISVAAVEFADKLMPIALWSKQAVIAVGHATQQALQARGVSALVPHNHDSEGLLALAPLQHVQQQDVLIIRGDGGRERLANDLRQRGASVHYFESYQRVWRRHSLALVKTWQQQQINCILITSNALLEFIVNLINNADNYWREECLWIVASQRIASNAENLGIKRVINANGASQQALLLALSAQ